MKSKPTEKEVSSLVAAKPASLPWKHVHGVIVGRPKKHREEHGRRVPRVPSTIVAQLETFEHGGNYSNYSSSVRGDHGNLIAMACNSYHDMLEACQEVLETIEYFLPKGKLNGAGFNQHADKLRSAIAKATGKA